MRLRFTSAHAVAFGCLAAVASCFPDPLPDDGIPDSGIFLSEGGTTNPEASASGLDISVATVDFGLADCGGTAPANQKLTIKNKGDAEVSYALTATGVGFAVVSAAAGKIPGNGSIDVELSAAAVSAFATAAGTNEGALQIVTDAPGQKLYSVGLKETAHGGQLVVTPDTADFGVVSPNGQTLDIPFHNFGNAPVKVSILTLPNGYTVNVEGGATDGTLAAGETRTLHVTLPAAGDPPSEFTGDYKVEGTPLCGGQVSGATGHYEVFSQTTNSLYPQITPGILAFDVSGSGFTPCGQKAGSKAVTVSNPTNGEYNIVTVVSTDLTGPFTVTPAVDSDNESTHIDLAAGNSQTFTVVPSTLAPPQATTPGGASGSLHIALSNETEYTVTLYQTAQGAVFA
ncbi:MAG TPA: hypothetical protein VF407_22970, partial [Polyangiaceae bacterium]